MPYIGGQTALFGLALASISVLAQTQVKPDRVQPLPLKQVTVADTFWAPKLKTYKEFTIPHSWPYVSWEIRALQRANGRPVEGEPNGTWGEANLYKFLETAAHSLAIFPDPALEKRVDDIIALVAGAQQADGYVHAYITNSKKIPWDPDFLDGSHDGYVLGHMIEAALEYYASTGKTAFLDVAAKAAGHAWRHFLGPEGKPGFCGHAELEMALVELYRVRPEPRYLELAKAFVEWRGRHVVKPFSETPRAYFQDHVPLREQRTLEGHAVRAIFFATGVADMALATGDPDYRLAADRFWNSTTLRRMNIAGGIGPRREHEALGEDYELPNDGYYESCAACGLADFAQRLFWLDPRADYADVLERTLYNTILHGQGLSGTNSYYQNPLSDHDNARYNSWVCCPPNLSRTLFQVGRYAYGFRADDLYVNLYVGGQCRTPLRSGEVRLICATEYPWDGRVKITVLPQAETRFAMHLRLPGWCEHAQLKLNGETLPRLPLDDHGYLTLERSWKARDEVELHLEMPVQRLVAHPRVLSCAGKVALQRGPIVYAFEGLDNPGLATLQLGTDPRFIEEHRPELLGGITVIKGATANGKPFQAIPFYALANREKSTQEVWVAQADLKPGDDWWEGRLYRPLPSHWLKPKK